MRDEIVKEKDLMKNRDYNPILAAVAYTLGNMLIKAVPFFTLPLFTRLLSTADYGLYNTYLSYESIITILLGFGLTGSIRVAKVEFEDKYDDFITSIYGLQILLAGIIAMIAFAAFVLIKPNIWISKQLFAILLTHCICSQVFNIGSAKYAICGDVKSNLIMSILSTSINVFSSLFLCIYFFPNNMYLGRIIGTYVGILIVAIVILVRQAAISRRWFDIYYWKYALKLGAPLILHSLSLTLLYQCDKIMIQAISGNSEAGIYSIAVTISGIVTVLVSSIDNAWAPWFYSNLKNKNYDSVRKFDDYMILIFLCITICIMMVSPEIIKLFSAREYWGAIYAISPLLVSIFFNFVYLIPVNFEYYHKKTGYIAYSSVITTVINIALNYLFIYIFGFIGAAYATCISKLILLIMHLFRARRIEKVRLFTGHKLIIYIVLGCFFIPFTLFTIEYIVIRLVVMLLLVVFLGFMIRKDNLVSIIKKL